MSQVSRPSALLFDFGGTLDCPSHWLDRFVSHYRSSGFAIERAELDPAFSHATEAGYRVSKRLEKFNLIELVRFLVGQQWEYLRAQGPEGYREMISAMAPRDRFGAVEKISESFVRETSQGMRRNAEVIAMLSESYKIGVVSNWYGNLETILTEAGMRKFVRAIGDSSRLGVFKPDPAIFSKTLAMLHVEPGAAAMVGDSMLKDCAPAHRLGMQTVLLRIEGATATAQEIDFAPDYVIGSLEELLKFRW
ncbi:MAG TPA: HAD family hydrolase [Candidatus Binataceae bacterium]|nr:HAD family hydrolase [Candidatus Binataceae bacterium]